MSDSVPPSEDRYQILARSALKERVLKHDETFAVFDRHGNVGAGSSVGSEGLYHEGTRFLSRFRLRLNKEPLLLLSSTVRENDGVLTADSMNPDLAHAMQAPLMHGALHIYRSKFLWRGACYERLRITSYSATPIEVCLQVDFAADFVDVFEVRGTARARRGTLEPARYEGSDALLSYMGLDDERRTTRIRFSPKPHSLDNGHAELRLSLSLGQIEDVFITVSCETERFGRKPVLSSFDEAYEAARSGFEATEQALCGIDSSNGRFNAWMRRSLADLRMLVTDTSYGSYPYAGVPWFSTPFGRDGIITALSALWLRPELGLGVLRFLAATQADREYPTADAEPGKILHELRLGEMAKLGEIPFGKYYGAVDSTPLFVMLAAAYYETTGDLASISELWGHIERALTWMDVYGDRDRDGFLEYHRQSDTGLVQQGWKDSSDSVFHADGSAAQGPIALCEVQGYAYAALNGAAKLASALGHFEQSQALHDRADALRIAFDKAFWCDDLSTYALALDGRKQPCRVRSSNAGHCLMTGIALPERALPLADQLLSDEMFSGWGIRTLGSGEVRYNPMSYHNGSVWPHDNAMIAAGMSRYGLMPHALRVLTAIFDCSAVMDLHRLPELFCGFVRREGEGPTLYPVACAPQAWAAAAPFMLLQAALGMTVDAPRQQARFERAALPSFLDDLQLSRLRVGAASLDLRFHRYPDAVGINVLGRRGRASVLTIK